MAFYWCPGLTNIYALRADPKAYNCNSSAFEKVPTSTCTLNVPTGSKDAYMALEPWSNFKNIVEEDFTDIQHLTLSPAEASKTYYDLHGRRVNAQAKGIIIVGGKKIIK